MLDPISSYPPCRNPLDRAFEWQAEWKKLMGLRHDMLVVKPVEAKEVLELGHQFSLYTRVSKRIFCEQTTHGKDYED